MYILKRHLTRYLGVKPGAKACGVHKGEEYWLRKDVKTLHTADRCVLSLGRSMSLSWCLLASASCASWLALLSMAHCCCCCCCHIAASAATCLLGASIVCPGLHCTSCMLHGLRLSPCTH